MDLFDEPARDIALGEGAALLGGFARQLEAKLLAAVDAIVKVSPLRHMTTPGGHRMSVAMTNCGGIGWVTDRTGYRYDLIDPETGRAWPVMPSLFADLAASAAENAGFPSFLPDACLINRYVPGARLTLHQDRNERDFGAPIVSVSLGLPAVFLWGGLSRTDRIRRMRLNSGDVVVWGGQSRLTFHGIDTLKSGEHDLAGAFRFNFTFRHAG